MNRFEFLNHTAMLISNAQAMNLTVQGDYEWNNLQDCNFTTVKDHAQSLYTETRSIQDKEFLNYLDNIHFEYSRISNTFNCDATLKNDFIKWIQPKLKGIDHFTFKLQNNTQTSLIEFLLQNYQKKIYIHRNAYWQQGYLEHYNLNVTTFSEFTNIPKKSAVILDIPLRGEMSTPDWLQECLLYCDSMAINVFIDITFLPVVKSPHVLVDHKCIKVISCGLSKVWPVTSFGLGVCGISPEYVKPRNHYNLQKQNIFLLSKLFTKFDINFILEKYQPEQKFWCNLLGLDESNCVLHAVGSDDLKQFYTDKFWNNDLKFREKNICLTSLYENYDLISSYWKQQGIDINKIRLSH